MPQPLRLLLIDDNRSDRALVIRELRQEFSDIEIQEIISSGEFDRAIAAGKFDVVITDFQLRWTTGLEILEALRLRYPSRPVVMFTNTGTEEVAVEAMKMGLDDYIIKHPNRYGRVPASVRLALERRKTQQHVALLEIRLERLLNQVRVGIFRSQPDGTLLESNPAFLELLRVESIAQANALNLLNTGACYMQLIELPPPQHLEQEIQLKRSDGSQFWAILTVTLNTVDGITIVDGLLEDISERKQAEVVLQQVNANLEDRVQERTAQLHEVNQDLEEFAYSISHDLRAPLRTIQGYAQILLEDLGETLDDSHLLYLQRIAVNAQQLGSLITDLLAYSRLRQADIVLEPVSIAPLLSQVLAQLDSEVQERKAQIQIDEPLPVVRANRPILTQVLTNLLSNALKFVGEGVQPQVRISAEQRSHQTRLWIEDNGIGIAADRQQEIFSPFTRLHGVEEYPGTGIGLAIARKGVERMQGQIGVESESGHGSRFWIELATAMESS